MEGLLEEQITYSLDFFKKCISNIRKNQFDFFELQSSITNNDLANFFTQKRNKIAHGDMTDEFLTNGEIVSAVIIERIIHCMIFYRAEFSIEEIAKLVDDRY